MKHSHLLLALALVPPAAAQDLTLSEEGRRGPASSLAVGLSFRPADRPVGHDEALYAKGPLDRGAFPPRWQDGGFVHGDPYDPATLFAALTADITDVVEIDAMSTGNDLIPTPAAGSPGIPDVVGQNSWLGVVASFRDDPTRTEGAEGGLVHSAQGGGRGMGSDLFSYYQTGSTGVHPTIEGSVFLEQSAQHLGLPTGTTADLDALDLALSVRAWGRGTLPGRLFHRTGEFYFSLDPDCIEAVNGALGGQFAEVDANQWAPADAATIYQLLFDGTAWSTPRIYRTPAQLGLAATGEDVDALAVDPANEVVVFSTQPVPGRSQILLHDENTTSTPLRDRPGVNATAMFATHDDEDDVDGLCIPDPEMGEIPTHMGVPIQVEPFPGQAHPLSLSVTREGAVDPDPLVPNDPGVPETLHMLVSGRADVPQTVMMMVSFDHVPGQPVASATWLQLSGQQFAAPGDYSLPFQASLANLTQPTGMSLMAVRFDVGSPMTLSGFSWISRIQFDL